VVLISDAEIEADRAFANEQLTDQCRIVRPGASGSGTFNETTLQYDTPAADVVVYEGPCRWQIKVDVNTNLVEPQELEREWAYQTSTLQLPVAGSEAVRSNDVATCVYARFDDALVGRVFNVQSVQRKSMAVTRKFRVREVIR
jgi:hypothetical protein